MLAVASITVAIAIASGLLFCGLIWGASTRLWVGLGLVTVFYVLESARMLVGALRVGVLIYPLDVIFALLAVAGGIRYLTTRRIRDLPVVWLLLIALMFGNAILGLIKFKTAAGVEFRSYFFFLVGVTYFASFPDTTSNRTTIVNGWLWMALGIVSLAIYRWTMMGLGLEGYADLDLTGGVAGRVINSAETFVLAGALVMLAYGLMHGITSKAWLWLLPLIFLTIVGSQQRTVWVCTLVGIGLMFLLERGRSGRLLAVLFVFVSLLSVAVLLGGGYLEHATQTVAGAAVGGLNTSGGTFIGRVDSWKELLREYVNSSLTNMVIGKPFGSGFARVVRGQELTYAPHNYYIEVLLRGGVIGLCLLLSIYGSVMITLMKDRQGDQVGYTRMLWVLLAMQLVYSITYSPNTVQAVILGASLGIVISRRNQVAGRVAVEVQPENPNAPNRRAHGLP